MPSSHYYDERRPLLANRIVRESQRRASTHKVDFQDDDPEHPRNWSLRAKYLQVLQIWMIAFLLPAASSMPTPAAEAMQKSFQCSRQLVLAGQAAFVCMLGVGPLFHAPMSETFGRRKIFLTNLIAFTIIQIPTALVSDAVPYICLRILSGFCGSVGVANGGGSISDMFAKPDRAKILGFYFTAPLLAPAIGALVGCFIVAHTTWRVIFWTMTVSALVVTVCCYCFLPETRAIAILEARRQEMTKHYPGIRFVVEGQKNESIGRKVLRNSTKAVKILATQPIVLAMSIYQALVFTSMYTLYARFTKIWSSPPYNFTKEMVGLAYLGPAAGFILMSVLVVSTVDRVNRLLEEYYDDDEPEYRLLIANVGAVFLPVSLFWFGIAVEKDTAWPVPLIAAMFFGASQIGIFNPIQT